MGKSQFYFSRQLHLYANGKLCLVPVVTFAAVATPPNRKRIRILFHIYSNCDCFRVLGVSRQGPLYGGAAFGGKIMTLKRIKWSDLIPIPIRADVHKHKNIDSIPIVIIRRGAKAPDLPKQDQTRCEYLCLCRCCERRNYILTKSQHARWAEAAARIYRLAPHRCQAEAGKCLHDAFSTKLKMKIGDELIESYNSIKSSGIEF